MKYLKIIFKICFTLNFILQNIKAAQESYDAQQPFISLPSSKRSSSQRTSPSSIEQPSDKKTKIASQESKGSSESDTHPQVRKCGIWRSNLNYIYRDEVFSTHDWHIKTAQVIKEKGDRSDSHDHFAKVRVEAVFRKSKSVASSFVQKYEPDYMFSGSFDKDSLSLSDLVAISDENPNALTFLKQLFGEGLKLDYEFKKKRHHPEIAILFDTLVRPKHWIEKITPSDKTAKLDYLVLTICSFFDPCSTCSAHLFDAGNPNGFFLKGIRKALESYEKDFKISKKMRIFINVSSLNSFEDSQALPPLLSNNIHLPNLDSKEYYPFFAQMRLNFASNPETQAWGSFPSIPPYVFVSDSSNPTEHSKLSPPAA